jgi:hypothetical protein
VLSKVTIISPESGDKIQFQKGWPEVVKVTTVPGAPEFGVKISALLGALATVKVADGVLVPSLKTTVLLPEVEEGTVNVAVRSPDAPVVEELKVMELPPNVAVQPA